MFTVAPPCCGYTLCNVNVTNDSSYSISACCCAWNYKITHKHTPSITAAAEVRRDGRRCCTATEYHQSWTNVSADGSVFRTTEPTGRGKPCQTTQVWYFPPPADADDAVHTANMKRLKGLGVTSVMGPCLTAIQQD